MEDKDLFSDKLGKSEVLSKLRHLIDEKVENVSVSRTAKLCIWYMRYLDIIKYFIRAERSGNWLEPLKAMSRMLNLFAASGHHNYASGRLYLQTMGQFEWEHPW